MSDLGLLADTMEEWSTTSGDHHMLAAAAIRQLIKLQAALQRSGEPVAWLCDAGDGENINATCSLTALADYKRFGRKITPLYTTPQPVADVNQQLVDALKKAESHLVATMEHIDHWPRKFQEHHWQQVLDLRQALLSAGKGGDSDAPEMKTYRCVTCNVSGTDDGLCDAHKYDEQLSKHKSAGKDTV